MTSGTNPVEGPGRIPDWSEGVVRFPGTTLAGAKGPAPPPGTRPAATEGTVVGTDLAVTGETAPPPGTRTAGPAVVAKGGMGPREAGKGEGAVPEQNRQAAVAAVVAVAAEGLVVAAAGRRGPKRVEGKPAGRGKQVGREAGNRPVVGLDRQVGPRRLAAAAGDSGSLAGLGRPAGPAGPAVGQARGCRPAAAAAAAGGTAAGAAAVPAAASAGPTALPLLPSLKCLEGKVRVKWYAYCVLG